LRSRLPFEEDEVPRRKGSRSGRRRPPPSAEDVEWDEADEIGLDAPRKGPKRRRRPLGNDLEEIDPAPASRAPWLPPARR